MERTILHIDMNNFYATVECMLNPSLKGKPVAVCGNTEERHGIVLAKNYAAKAYGVKTGDVNWEAKQKCPGLVIVPPHYEEYIKYSKLARRIYADYSDRIEPFGMDEVWLDATGTMGIFGNGEHLADEIRERIRFELGLTVSVGVSFNKVFAKLGSDMKKPDATTVISGSDWREKVWPLPVEELLGVGRATKQVMDRYCIKTIGDLARANVNLLAYQLKSRAWQLVAFANGNDHSHVLHKDFVVPAKSVGHGITTLQDLENEQEVWNVMLELVQDINRKLVEYGKKAGGIAIYVRDNALITKQWQHKLELPIQASLSLAREAFNLFKRFYTWQRPIRSVTVSAIDLCDASVPVQRTLFADNDRDEKLDKLGETICGIRARFGKDAIRNASLLCDLKMDTNRVELKMPTGMITMGG